MASVVVTVTAERDVVNELDESAIAAEIVEAVKKFINSYKIGISLLLSDLIVDLKRISYLADVAIQEPSGNVEIDGNQIVRFESCSVTVVIE
jgi:hypothetical protein